MECEDCFHVQTSEVLEDFSNYKYSTPEALRPYLEDQAKDLKNRYPDAKTVVEIGANNGLNVGILEKCFDTVLGIDPAGKHPVIPNRFNKRSASVINNHFGKVDLIVANHVFAHIDDLDGVFEGIDYLLKDEGALVFEVSDFEKMAISGRYDTIYHEHLDQHTLRPWTKFLRKHNLETNHFEWNMKVQTSSLRIHCRRLEDGGLSLPEANIRWRTYKTKIKGNQESLLARLPEKFCIWGASAKATTLIHQLGIKDRIAYCVDNTPAKEGLWLPGTAIKIRDHFSTSPDYCPVLLTAWNFEDEFKKQYPDREYILPYE